MLLRDEEATLICRSTPEINVMQFRRGPFKAEGANESAEVVHQL
jgi:hypothetical protein